MHNRDHDDRRYERPFNEPQQGARDESSRGWGDSHQQSQYAQGGRQQGGGYGSGYGGDRANVGYDRGGEFQERRFTRDWEHGSSPSYRDDISGADWGAHRRDAGRDFGGDLGRDAGRSPGRAGYEPRGSSGDRGPAQNRDPWRSSGPRDTYASSSGAGRASGSARAGAPYEDEGTRGGGYGYGSWDQDDRYRDDPRAGRLPSHGRQHDPDYHQWRQEQIRALDDDYDRWRQERYGRFSDEFSTWRSSRQKQAGSGGGAPSGRAPATGSGGTVAGSAGPQAGQAETGSNKQHK